MTRRAIVEEALRRFEGQPPDGESWTHAAGAKLIGASAADLRRLEKAGLARPSAFGHRGEPRWSLADLFLSALVGPIAEHAEPKVAALVATTLRDTLGSDDDAAVLRWYGSWDAWLVTPLTAVGVVAAIAEQEGAVVVWEVLDPTAVPADAFTDYPTPDEVDTFRRRLEAAPALVPGAETPTARLPFSRVALDLLAAIVGEP